MYLAAIVIGLCAFYFVAFWLFSIFFKGEPGKVSRKAWSSVAVIFGITVVGYVVTFLIPDLELANRFLHVVVGGFLCVLICFLVVRDGGFRINKLQFFIASVLVVTTLGALNEHLEFFLQTYVRFLFYSNPKDTWLDLLSNSVGILIANACLLWSVNRSPKLANTNEAVHIVEGQ